MTIRPRRRIRNRLPGTHTRCAQAGVTLTATHTGLPSASRRPESPTYAGTQSNSATVWQPLNSCVQGGMSVATRQVAGSFPWEYPAEGCSTKFPLAFSAVLAGRTTPVTASHAPRGIPGASRWEAPLGSNPVTMSTGAFPSASTKQDDAAPGPDARCRPRPDPSRRSVQPRIPFRCAL